MLKIKRNDEVIVIAGKDKGKRGKVQKVRADGKVIVSGVNMIKKHQRANPNLGQPGGIIEKEAALDASNVAIFNPESQKADRVGFRIESGQKLRFFKSNNALIDA